MQATTWSLYQYSHRLRAQGPTPYPSRISRHISLSNASYALCRSRKIACRTSSCMDVNWRIILDSREAVPVPQLVNKPWRTLWKAVEAVKRQLRSTVTTLHTTSTIHMPCWYPPSLVIRTTACHMNSSAIRSSWKATCNITSTFWQCYSSVIVVSTISASVSAAFVSNFISIFIPISVPPFFYPAVYAAASAPPPSEPP